MGGLPPTRGVIGGTTQLQSYRSCPQLGGYGGLAPNWGLSGACPNLGVMGACPQLGGLWGLTPIVRGGYGGLAPIRGDYEGHHREEKSKTILPGEREGVKNQLVDKTMTLCKPERLPNKLG